MKLVISIQSIKFPLTGIGRYTFELIKHIKNIDGITDIVYFDGTRIINKLPKPNYGENKFHSIISIMKRLFGNFKIFVILFKHFRSFLVHNNLNKYNDYVFHGTNFYLPSFPGKRIVTIHDLSVITHPHFHPSERVNMLYSEIEKSIYNSDVIITDSSYVKQEILLRYNISADRVKTVYLSHGEEYRLHAHGDVQGTLDRYGIMWKKYILFVGTIEPRKNIIALLEAFAGMADYYKKMYRIVLVGHKGWSNKDIFEKIELYKSEGWLLYIGFVEEKELPDIYAGAEIFVFPSFYEGFGLPVLEAMASGIPVICSNSSSLPEVCGDAAELFDPYDTDRLRELIQNVIDDGELREDLISRGLKRSAEFSWDKCALETYKVYQMHLDR